MGATTQKAEPSWSTGTGSVCSCGGAASALWGASCVLDGDSAESDAVQCISSTWSDLQTAASAAALSFSQQLRSKYRRSVELKQF